MAMTLRLTDDETAALRARAELEQRSMQEVARAAWRVARPMVLFLRAEDLLYVASRVLGEQPLVLGINGRRLTWTNDEAYDFIVAIATGELAGVPRSQTEFGQRPSRPSPRSSPWQAVSYSHRNGGSVASVRLNVAANSGPSNSAVSASVMVIVPDTALSRPTPGMSPSAMFGLAFHHTPSIRVVLTPQWTQSE